MAWTASLKQKRFDTGVIHFVVTYDDGVGNTFDEPVDIASAGDVLAALRRIYQRLQELAQLTQIFANAPLGLIDVSAAVPQPPPPLTAQQIWFNNWRRLQFANDLVNAQIISSTDTDYLALKSLVQTTFLKSYV